MQVANELIYACQTKDGVDVMIYFWNDVQNPTFCGWWHAPEMPAMSFNDDDQSHDIFLEISQYAL